MTSFNRLLLYSTMRQGKLHSLDSTLKYLGNDSLCWYEFERNQTPLYMACLINDVRLVEFVLKKGFKVDQELSDDEEECIHVACELGYAEIVNCLLDHGAEVNSYGGREELTPIHVAALCGHKGVVRVLMERGANIKDNECGRTPLHMACIGGNHEIVKLLVDAGADVNKSTSEGRTPLHLAAELGYPWVISVLLEAGAEIEALSENEAHYSTYCGNINTTVSPLYLAVDNQQLEATIILLNSGANINVLVRRSLCPLHTACYNGDRALVELLLEHGAVVDCEAALYSGTPLFVAYNKGHHEIIKLLLDAGADVNMYNHDRTLLHEAASQGDSGVIRILLDAGAQINALSKSKKNYYCTYQTKVSPLHLAVYNRHLEAAIILLKSGAAVDIPESIVSPLHAACYIGDRTLVKLLLEYGADVNCKADNESGYTPLITATVQGHYEIVKLLADAGADVNEFSCQSTALHYAASRGDSGIIRVLLDAGAQINALSLNEVYLPTHYGSARTKVSPLYSAVKNHHLEAATILLEAGAKIDILESNFSPLHAACYHGTCSLVELLLKHGADVNLKPKVGGQTPLHLACIDGHHEIVKLLVDAGANVNECTTFEQYTFAPLHYAANRGHSTVIRILLEAGALINVLSKEEQQLEDCRMSRVSPLHLAVAEHKREAATILLKSGAETDIPECKFSPLHAACFKNDHKMVEILLEHGVDVDTQTADSKETPLEMVTYSEDCDVDIVELLLAYGAEVNLPDKDGHDPVGNALGNWEPEVLELLLDHGGVPSPEMVDVMLSDNKFFCIAQKHFIKIKTAEMCSPSEHCIYAYERPIHPIVEASLEHYEDMCRQDISFMKIRRIGSTDVTYYDLLRRGASVCRNHDVVEALEQSRDFTNDFPMYRGLLTTSYKRGVKRRKSLDSGYPAFAHLMKVDLPILVVDKLFAYLSNKDLENLATLYKEVRRAPEQQKEKAKASKEQLQEHHAGEFTANLAKKRESYATEDDGNAPGDSTAAPPSKTTRHN